MLFLGAENAGMGVTGIIIYMVALVAIMYFLMIRPQKKEQKKKEELMAALAVGDSVLTTSGFYGKIIDMTSDMVIVEFGDNKNCRIPMQKAAIVSSEKPDYSNKTENKN